MKFRKLLAATLSVSVLISTAGFNFGASYATGNPTKKNPHRIYLKTGVLEPGQGNIRVRQQRSSGNEIGTYIVAFNRPVTEEMKSSVTKTGAKLFDYIPDFSFLSYMNSDEVDKVKSLECVSDVVPYEAQYKIDPSLAKKIGATNAVNLENEVAVNISTFDDDSSKLNSEIAKSVAVNVKRGKGSVSAKLKLKSIADLSKLDDVKYIEEDVEAKINNDISRGIMGFESFPSLGYEGTGQVVGISDSGIDTGNPGLSNNTIHPDFSGRIDKILDDKYPADKNGGADEVGHGTHTSGSILGSGQMSGGKIKGTAPKAHLIMQAVIDKNGSVNTPLTMYDLLDEAYTYGARVHSNSWGKSVKGEYTGNCSDVDSFVWSHPDMTVLFSAGNDGRNGYCTVGAPGSSKNCITVGASENFRPYRPLDSGLNITDNPAERANFSSYGCSDGRIKPDVVAPGSSIVSTKSSLVDGDIYSGNQYYQYKNGTSMSTPLTAGSVAVIREYIQKNFSITSPSAALIKAFIINGALNQGYTQEQGWGKVSVYDSLLSTKIVDQGSSVQTGQVKTYAANCSVTSTDKPLKITLVWSDYPGSATAPKALVNDLDLKVTAPDGTVYNGNDFTAPFNSEVDRTNNVETVTINTPKTGTYQLEVSGYEISYGPQPFALVYSSDFFSIPKNLRAVSTTSSINLSWDAVPGASGYDLSIDGAAPISVTGTSYMHNNLVYNTTHTYKVRAKTTAKTGDWSGVLSASTLLFSPAALSSKASNSETCDSITISWAPVEQAMSYDVFLEGEPFAETTNTSCTFLTMEPKSSYHFGIRTRTEFNASDPSYIDAQTLDIGVTYKAPMSEARMNFGATAANDGKIYVFGGKKGPFYINTVEQYDPSTNKWTGKAPMSKCKIDMATVSSDNGKIYVIGGYDSSNYLNTVEEYNPSTNTWAIKASMPTARRSLGAVCIGGKIYAVGGNNGSELNTVEIYDPATNTWTSGAPMLTARSRFGISALNGKIEVMGGVNGSTNLKVYEEYDPQLNKWTTCKCLNHWNSDFAVSTLNGMLYVSGGANSNKVIEEYNPSTGLWTQMGQLPVKITGNSSVVMDGKLYILGGFDNDNSAYLADVIEYNTQQGVWKKNSDMNYHRQYFTSTILNGKIYAIGGIGAKDLGAAKLDSIEEYDPSQDTWTECPKMPAARAAASASAVNGKIYVAGGYDDSEYFNDMLEYDTVNKVWTAKASMPEFRCMHRSVVLNGYIYIIGGESSGSYTNTVLRYNPSNNTWDTVAPIAIPRKNFGLAVANGKIYIMGGTDVNGKVLDSIEEYNPATNTWTTKNPMPQVLAQFGIFSNNDKIYLIGGGLAGIGLDNDYFKEYDPVTQSWTDKGSFAYRASKFRTEFVDNKVYAIGGLEWVTDMLILDSVYSTDSFLPTLSAGSSIMEPKGGSKTIPLKISNVPSDGIYRSQAVIRFDPAKLKAVSASAGDVIPGGYGFTYSIDNTQGKVTVSFTGDIATQKLVKTDGTLANVEFDVLDSVNTIGSTALSLNKADCTLYKTPTYQYSGVKLNNGSLDIFIYGDVNGSSTVTTDDYNTVKNYVLNSPACFPYEYGFLAADVDGNGTVNGTDLSLISRYLQGLITKFPAQK